MKTQLTLTFLALFMLFSCQNSIENQIPQVYNYNWKNTNDRTWVGPQFWANRLQDWHIQNERLECKIPYPMRTVHLLKHQLGAIKDSFEISVEVGLIPSEDSISSNSSAGILIGAGKDLDYRAASLIHHSYGKNAGIYVGFDLNKNLFIRDFKQENSFYERIKFTKEENFGKVKIIIK